MKEEQKRVEAHFQETASYWKEIYQGGDVSATIYQQRRDAVLALVDKLGLAAQSDILEVGCGAGVTSVALARRGYQVQAVDSVTAMIDLTCQAVSDAGLGERVTPSVCDVNSLAFADDAFDLVLAIGVIPWVQSPEQVLQQMTRVVRPGGYLIVSSENLWQLHHVLDPLLNPLLVQLRPRVGDLLRNIGLRKPLASPRHHACSNQEFDQQLASLQMEKLESMTLGFGPFTLFFQRVLPESVGVKFHRVLQRLADRGVPVLRSGGSNYIVLARKQARDAKLAA
jgi:ubiquinone/menaquinone biosynthesis C-methylase UbiE